MKIFISQPMRDKSDTQIKEERAAAIAKVTERFKGAPVVILDTFFEGAPHAAAPLWFLGKSIQVLGQADAAVFVGDWQNYRGCKAEYYIAKAYGIPVVEM